MRADENIDLPLPEGAERFRVSVLAPHGIGIHPLNARLRKGRDQRVLHFLRAHAGVLERRESARRAGRRHGGIEIAEMTAHARGAPVKRQRHAAIRAHLDVAALRALQRGSVAAPIEKNDRLLVPREPRVDRLDQARREQRRRIVLLGGADVEHMRHRHLALLHAHGQRRQPVLALLRVMVRLERRRGRAEQHGHALEMAAHHLVLLIDHDEAEPVQRREDGRPRADDDARAPGADVLPLIVPLARGEMAVQHGDADFLPDEARAKMLDCLRRERDFRHEHQRAFTQRQHLRDGLQINFRLAAAGHAVEQDHARFFRGDFSAHDFQRGGLVRVERPRRRFRHGRVQVGVAVLRARLDDDELALGQAVPRRRADARIAAEIGQPAGAGFREKMPCGELRLGAFQGGERFLRQRGEAALDPQALLEGGIGVAHGLGQDAEQGDGQRRAIILRHPLREFDQAGGQKRALAEDLLDLAQLAGVRRGGEIDHVADQHPRLERHAHFRAQDDLRVERGRDRVVKRAIQRDFGNDTGNAGHIRP